MDTSGRRFKFEAMLQDHSEFEAFLANSWNFSTDNVKGWVDFTQRVGKSTRDMVGWHKKTFKNAKNEIDKLNSRLQVLLNRDHDGVPWDSVNQPRK